MDQAIDAGAIALFGEKYGEVVRVVSIGENSTELCGGTHVGASGDIGTFRIRSETGVAAGVRRIEAVAGVTGLEYMAAEQATLESLCELIRSPKDQLTDKVAQLLEENRELGKRLEKLQSKISSQAGSDLASNVVEVAGINLVLQKVEQADAKALRAMIDQLKQSLTDAVVVLASEGEGKAVLIAGVSKTVSDRVSAGDLVKEVATPLGGKGGGRGDMAQAGAPSLNGIDEVFAGIPAWIENKLG